MNLRHATSGDIPFIMELEQASASAAHWNEEQYRCAIEQGDEGPERIVLVAETVDQVPAQAGLGGPRLTGFIVARHLVSEWELENLVVAAQSRRQRIGAALLAALLDRARDTNSQQVFLEVRISNTAARNLYARAGFRESGRRKMYYSDPPEDAILYSHNVV